MNQKELKHPFFVIIGPSGSGKTKVAEAVFPANYKVVSHTTRPIRKDEVDGVDYYFETNQQFEQLIKEHALAEHDHYHGYKYGVGVADLLEKTSNHYAFDVLTLKGFQDIEAIFGEKVIPIFLNVSKQNVLSRLNEREQDLKLINERLALYDQEAKNKESLKHYKNTYFVDADQPFEAVVNAVKQIVNNNL
ncbi:guanylate kinase [Enterococcus sp. 5H]|uniref:guanylate kinase n=1 Tax=Enterococcus sp. 5H TaxID=1229490 RepID=UPI00230295E6|nr:guanylate kinase [Enterococcus sp. 5H]MDA9470873.1 Guanylate kinase [Enterococcus sp. 5H]